MTIDILINVVSDAMEFTQEYIDFCRKLHPKHKIPPKDSIWVPSLPGSDAYRLGELCEREDARWTSVSQICWLMELDQDLLIATVKSIKRWEAHNGLYDRSLCLQIKTVKERALRFLSDKNKEKQYYESTGRMKRWCIPEKSRKISPGLRLGWEILKKR